MELLLRQTIKSYQPLVPRTVLTKYIVLVTSYFFLHVVLLWPRFLHTLHLTCPLAFDSFEDGPAALLPLPVLPSSASPSPMAKLTSRPSFRASTSYARAASSSSP